MPGQAVFGMDEAAYPYQPPPMLTPAPTPPYSAPIQLELAGLCTPLKQLALVGLLKAYVALED